MDPLVLGIITVILVEQGTLTPPVGFHLFVIKDIAEAKSVTEVARGAVPTLILHFVALVIIFIFPILVTWFPDKMM